MCKSEKKIDDISAEIEEEKNVDVLCRLVLYGGKIFCVWK